MKQQIIAHRQDCSVTHQPLSQFIGITLMVKYKDYNPLGEPIEIRTPEPATQANGASSKTSSSSSTPSAAPPTVPLTFTVGDRVKVNLDVAILKQMQEGHGGWNPKMATYIGKVGTVHR